MKIDIGCYDSKKDGFIGVDVLHSPKVDIISCLPSLCFADNSIDEIYSSYMLEHADNILDCVQEMYRVCKNGAIIRIIVPHGSNIYFWSDPTHKQAFSTRSFEYYDLEHSQRAGHPVYLPKVNIKTHKVMLKWWSERNRIDKPLIKRAILNVFNWLFSGLANLNHLLCERFWCYWVGGFFQVEFTLEVIKD